jgi:hypothetical protein
MSSIGKWIEPKIVMLSEISQTEKDKYHMFSLTCRIYTEKKKKRMTQVFDGNSLGLGLSRNGRAKYGGWWDEYG